MKRHLKTMALAVGLAAVVSQAQAESWALAVGVGGANGGVSFGYSSGAAVHIAPPPTVRVSPVVACPPAVVHRVPHYVRVRPTLRHQPWRGRAVVAPMRRVYVVPSYVVGPHQPVIVMNCR